jgi:hypothetical protein
MTQSYNKRLQYYFQKYEFLLTVSKKNDGQYITKRMVLFGLNATRNCEEGVFWIGVACKSCACISLANEISTIRTEQVFTGLFLFSHLCNDASCIRAYVLHTHLRKAIHLLLSTTKISVSSACPFLCFPCCTNLLSYRE